MKSALKALMIAQSSVFARSYCVPSLQQKRSSFFLVNHHHVLYRTQSTVLPSTSTSAAAAAAAANNQNNNNKNNGNKKDWARRVRRNTQQKQFVTESKVSNNGRGRKNNNYYFNTTASACTTTLLEPTVVFSNNHLLIVNKPPGFHAQPNEAISTYDSSTKNKKCMLSKLKSLQLGGGAFKDFLLPMHRLDQPCTGILLLGKTSKAGTRVGNAFRTHKIEKEYFCLVHGSLQTMKHMSVAQNHKSFIVDGIMKKQIHQSRSVRFVPVQTQKNNHDGTNDGRRCQLQWEYILSAPTSNNLHLILVRTSTGARHQIRAMLSQLLKSPVAGDLRYGASNPLPDQSVALHGRSLRLPSVQLGDFDFKSNKFVAPIPLTWSKYFAITEEMIEKAGF